MGLVYILIVIALILVCRVTIRYDPLFDFVKSGDRYILYLWYTRYDEGEYTRTYIKIFEI